MNGSGMAYRLIYGDFRLDGIILLTIPSKVARSHGVEVADLPMTNFRLVRPVHLRLYRSENCFQMSAS